MSIQLNTKHNPLGLILSWLDVLRQILIRSQQSALPKIFFRYQTYKTHPGFDNYYKNPPVPWRNFYDADLLHWINYPKFIDKRPFIIESNDHPLSVVGWKKKAFEPAEVLALVDIAQKVYDHENCKAILIPCNGFRQLFEYYLPRKISGKLIEVSPLVCNLRKIDWDSRSRLPITFSCLASDYYLKGVDLVLQAWFSSDKKNDCKLILACPNIPLDMQSKIISDKSITLITKAPLTFKEKEMILSSSHVTLAPTHLHGGANVAEGLEYGHVPIAFEYHAKYFYGMGSTISVPYHFYTPEHYGTSWRTFNDFLQRLSTDKKKGVFNTTVEALANLLSEMSNNSERVHQLARECYDLSGVRFSGVTRNKKLLSIYEQALESQDVKIKY